jgi:hypothetical protein
MAKKQEMVLNIGKLSGLCSRLMCCLRYEYDGDLGTIATDDVIPLGAEDAPIEIIEKKISKSHQREKRPHAAKSNHPTQPGVHAPQAEPHAQKAPNDAKKQNVEAPAVPLSTPSTVPKEEDKKSDEQGQKDRRRFRRRRFKK